MTKNPEAVVRLLARAVIRRVQIENPGCDATELLTHLAAANPFHTHDEAVMQIWQEETAWVLQSYNFTMN